MGCERCSGQPEQGCRTHGQPQVPLSEVPGGAMWQAGEGDRSKGRGSKDGTQGGRAEILQHQGANFFFHFFLLLIFPAPVPLLCSFPHSFIHTPGLALFYYALIKHLLLHKLKGILIQFRAT